MCFGLAYGLNGLDTDLIDFIRVQSVVPLLADFMKHYLIDFIRV